MGIRLFITTFRLVPPAFCMSGAVGLGWVIASTFGAVYYYYTHTRIWESPPNPYLRWVTSEEDPVIFQSPSPTLPFHPLAPSLKRDGASQRTLVLFCLFSFFGGTHTSPTCGVRGGARKSQSGAFFEKKASCRISRFDGAKSYLSRPVRPVSKLGSNTTFV